MDFTKGYLIRYERIVAFVVLKCERCYLLPILSGCASALSETSGEGREICTVPAKQAAERTLARFVQDAG